MKMKKLFLSLMLMTGMAANAYEYPYLAFATTDGTVQTVSVESLSITVSDGKLVVTNSDGTVNFTLTDLSKMYFSTAQENSTGVQQIETTSGGIKVYSLTGLSMGTFETVAQARAALQSGVYVIKGNGKNYKINIKK